MRFHPAPRVPWPRLCVATFTTREPTPRNNAALQDAKSEQSKGSEIRAVAPLSTAST